jgi:hypothetical protein
MVEHSFNLVYWGQREGGFLEVKIEKRKNIAKSSPCTYSSTILDHGARWR